MGKIKRIISPDSNTLSALISIWESAVMETHTFLSVDEISQIKPDVKQALINIKYLYCFYEEEQMLGFIGVEDNKIEMLFIDALARGKGVGKQLISYALDHLHAYLVDVNEQNTQGVGFYKHLGFIEFSRSEQDEQGRPFPILHMKIE